MYMGNIQNRINKKPESKLCYFTVFEFIEMLLWFDNFFCIKVSSKECHYLQIFPANLTVIRSAVAFGLWNVLNDSVFWKKEQILGQFREKNTQKQDRYYAIVKVNELRKEAVHK